MDLKLCYELGRALRYGDPEEFFAVYDAFLTLEQQIPAEKLDRIKELARQISELELEDFVLVQSAVSARTNVEWSSDLISTLTLPFLERPLHPVSCSMKETTEPSGSATFVVKRSEPCIPVEDVGAVSVGSHCEQMSTMNLVAHNSNSFVSGEGVANSTSNNLPEKIKCSQIHCASISQNAQSRRGENSRSVKNSEKAFNHREVVNFLWKGWLQAQEDMHRDARNNHHS
ncbi:hypothetical protein EMCRGX_G024020 [Ephydatia muelleri]